MDSFFIDPWQAVVKLSEGQCVGVLRAKLRRDVTYGVAAWDACVGADPGWPAPVVLDVFVEEHLGESRRVDLHMGSRGLGQVVVVEVKVDESAVRAGQLLDYAYRLDRKYGVGGWRLVLLSPYTSARGAEAALVLPSVSEVEAVRAVYPTVRHLSWLDIIELPTAGVDPVWASFCEYVRQVVCRPRRQAGDTFATLANFFPEHVVANFAARLDIAGLEVGPNGQVDLRRIADAKAVAAAIATLLDSTDTTTISARSSRFDQRAPFLDSEWGQVHRELFRLVDSHRGAWLEGQRDYAVRVSPRKDGKRWKSVSVVRSRGMDTLLLPHAPSIEAPGA
jgi:hypothetical protein